MKIRFLLLLIAAVSYVSAQTSILKLNASKSEFKIISSSQTSLKAINTIAQLSTFQIKHKEKIFNRLQIDGYANNKDYGYPQLPTYNKLIEIPYDSEISIKIISYDEETIKLSDHGITNKIFPAQPSLSKGDNPDNVPFQFNEDYYNYDAFNNTSLVDVDLLGIMRGVQIGRLIIHPIRYNPVQNVLKVYNNMIIEIEFLYANVAKTNQLKQKYYSPFFNASLNKLANFSPNESKELISQYPIKYVIVADVMFQSTLQSFIQWKTKKGFHVIEAYTNNPNVGNTTTSIKTYLQNLYSSATVADPAPTFVLFVGDVAQVPSYVGVAGSHATDLYYCEYDGNGDYFPDVYYGRFSATNVSELQAQIDKNLEYEQYLMPDPTFLNEVVMISGVDASHSQTWGNGQINYGTSMYFNSTHGLLSHTYLYPASQNAAVSGQIINDVSKGVGFVNYTAHGSSDGWYEPSFENTNIASLGNNHRYPLMIGNCCLSNKFDDPACFGESLLRAANKGAYAYIGASNNSYWDEDYWWGTGSKAVAEFPVYDSTKLGAYDCMFHENGESESKWFITNSQMIHSGNLAVAEGAGSIQYYWEIYHLMGDPSVMNYFSVPATLAITYNNAIPVGITTLDVITEPHAYVAISFNNVLLDSKLADNSGIVHLSFPAFSTTCTANIVATKQNRIPFIGTLSIIPNTSAYVSYLSHVIDDSAANNNQQADFNEIIKLNISLKNVGMTAASGVNATLSTLDTNVIITDNAELFGSMSSNAIVTKNAAYTFQIKNFIEDQHNVLFKINTIDNNSNTWVSNFSITLNAPKLKVLSYTINDAQGNNNGKLDPGEHVSLSVVVNNYGHANSPVTVGSLSISNTDITINNSSFALGNINSNSVNTAVFGIDVSPNTPLGSQAAFTFVASAAPYSIQKNLSFSVGLIFEDWECNLLTHYNWINTSEMPWTLVTGSAYEGTNALKSGVIADSQTSDLSINISVLSADSISFYRKVSSENTYDFLYFYIDNIKVGEWSGEQAWGKVGYPITAGQHTLNWSYEKDYSMTGGSDCAWIDFITFPIMEMPTNIHNEYSNATFNVFPNIFSDQAFINYELKANSKVSLTLVNTLGQTIENLINKSGQNSGKYDFSISAKSIESGVYFLKLQVDNVSQVKKIMITK